MARTTKALNAAEYIAEEDTQAGVLSEALASGDLNVITNAIGLAARARGMSDVARATGVTRTGLYAALRQGGNPSLGTVLRVLKALGLGLEVKMLEST